MKRQHNNHAVDLVIYEDFQRYCSNPTATEPPISETSTPSVAQPTPTNITRGIYFFKVQILRRNYD